MSGGTTSLFLAMLLHASLTASNVILVPQGTGAVLVAGSPLVAAVRWAAVTVLACQGKL